MVKVIEEDRYKCEACSFVEQMLFMNNYPTDLVVIDEIEKALFEAVKMDINYEQEEKEKINKYVSRCFAEYRRKVFYDLEMYC